MIRLCGKHAKARWFGEMHMGMGLRIPTVRSLSSLTAPPECQYIRTTTETSTHGVVSLHEANVHLCACECVGMAKQNGRCTHYIHVHGWLTCTALLLPPAGMHNALRQKSCCAKAKSMSARTN
eukprot:scaffold141615_cov43-Tisochrysis_lutea.AAC.2